jgi:hypothetical protein
MSQSIRKILFGFLIAGLAIVAITSIIGLFGRSISSKTEVIGDIINVDQVKSECRTKINNMDAKMEQFRNSYSKYGLTVQELTKNANASAEVTKKINESALGLIWSNKGQSTSDSVREQEKAFNTLVTTLPQLQQQFQGADQQLFKEISQEIRTSRNKLEGTGNELISLKTDFKNYLEKKTKYNINDGGTQLINIYQYNGCIPTARGTNNLDDAIKWIDDRYFTPSSAAANDTFKTKEDKSVL